MQEAPVPHRGSGSKEAYIVPYIEGLNSLRLYIEYLFRRVFYRARGSRGIRISIVLAKAEIVKVIRYNI